MSNSIAKLVSVGSQSLGGPLGPIDEIGGTLISSTELEEYGLIKLLKSKNGFYAFARALHVLPSTSTRECGLVEWNSNNLWRADYKGLADGCFFFAEDAFGGQFCLCNGSVVAFDPETGEKDRIAPNVAEWARRILDDYDLLTGHRLAQEWQAQHGALPAGQRLVPKVPFVLGGDFRVENLFPLEAAQAMRSRANLAVQIKDLPDGSKIEFKVVD